MKACLGFLFYFVITSCNAQSITPAQAKDSIGKNVTVCGKVESTYTSKAHDVFLNFGVPYPNQDFSVVIFSKDGSKFGSNPANMFKEKTICVTGKIELYKGKPEIIVSEAKQISEK